MKIKLVLISLFFSLETLAMQPYFPPDPVDIELDDFPGYSAPSEKYYGEIESIDVPTYDENGTFTVIANHGEKNVVSIFEYDKFEAFSNGVLVSSGNENSPQAGSTSNKQVSHTFTGLSPGVYEIRVSRVLDGLASGNGHDIFHESLSAFVAVGIEYIGTAGNPGFDESTAVYHSTVDGTSIAITDGGSPKIGDLRLAWNGSSYNTSTVTSAGWQASSVDIVLEDINVDGVVDLVLKNLDQAVATSGVYDQIVFGNPNSSTMPLAVTAIDEDLQQFFDDVQSWISNPNHFSEGGTSLVNRTIFVTETYFNAPWWCDVPPYNDTTPPPVFTLTFDSFDDGIINRNNHENDCLANDGILSRENVPIRYPVVVQVPAPNSAVFSQDAIDFTLLLGNLLSPGDGALPADEETFAAIEIIENILGVKTGDTFAAFTGTADTTLSDSIPSDKKDVIRARLILGAVIKRPRILLILIPQPIADEDEEALDEAEEFGEEIAVIQLEEAAEETDDFWPPRALIGEGEGNVYVRVPTRAVSVGAFYYPNLTDPSWSAPFDVLDPNDRDQIIAANAAWIRTLMYFETLIYDIGCYEGRNTRGIAYQAEKAAMGIYSKWIPWTVNDTDLDNSASQCLGF